MEIEENNQRKEFTDEELLEGYRRLERLRNPPLIIKFLSFLANLILKFAEWIKSLFSRGK
jgi:ParB family chromosome partitioning protein